MDDFVIFLMTATILFRLLLIFREKTENNLDNAQMIRFLLSII